MRIGCGSGIRQHRSPAKAGAQSGAKAARRPRSWTPACAAGTSSPTRTSATYDRLPGEIERLEAEIAADEAALHDPDLYARDPARFAELTERIARNRAEIEAAELRWLEVAELAEALER